ncbi:sodium-dependent low-affinity dicarboxylate transporter 1-like [Ornithodoros turicata]|uniref:sodium-dependent low-affinity dicarboxylate transporter 1-like n=1 Tax=Ornithodoros turicata TaxID=34597 RepID=UPI003139B935
MVLEVMSAPISALLPFVLFPLLGVPVNVDHLYSGVQQIGFLCSMLLLLAHEECGLSTRIALYVLSRTGSSIDRVLAIVVTASVGMTCVLDGFTVVVLLLPIIECTVDEIFFNTIHPSCHTPLGPPPAESSSSARSPRSDVWCGIQRTSYHVHRRRIFAESRKHIVDNRNTMFKTMMAALVYGTNIGSCGTPRGSQQNYYLVEYFRNCTAQDKLGSPLNYFTWTTYSLPSMMACSAFLWWYLYHRWLPAECRSGNHVDIEKFAFRNKYLEKRKWSFEQITTIILTGAYLFCTLVGQDWINVTADQVNLRSESLLVALACVLFLIPAQPSQGARSQGLLPWEAIHSRVPWGCLLLTGAGYAFSDALGEGRVTLLKCDWVLWLFKWSRTVGLGAGVFLQSVLVEIKSNTNSVIDLIPGLFATAQNEHVNPLLLLLPFTKAASLLFLLPISGYGNALLYDYARCSCWEMVQMGLPLKIVTVGLEMISLYTIGYTMFDLAKTSTAPVWPTQGGCVIVPTNVSQF